MIKGGGERKSFNLTDQVNALYLNLHGDKTIELADFPDDIDVDLEKWIASIFKGNPPEINRSILWKTATLLSQGIMEGFAGVDYNSQDIIALQALLLNVWQFAGFKTYAQGQEISKLLIGPNGQPRSFSEFRMEASKIGQIYNQNWLRTEYQHAVISSQAASKWVQIQKTKAALPLLQYDTAGDNRVRPEHAAMQGITLPVDDPFWMEFYPPNGWNCRCTVRQLAGGTITSKENIQYPDEKAVPKSFRYNIGEKLFVFPPDMPFYKVNPEVAKSISGQLLIELKQFVYSLPLDKQFIPVKYFDNGGAIHQHLLTNAIANDYQDLIFVANKLATEGKIIKLLPVINPKDELARKQIMPGAKFGKNPDMLIDGIPYELESLNKTRNFSPRVKHGFKQSNHVIILFKGKNFNFKKGWPNLEKEIEGIEDLRVINEEGKTVFKYP